MTLVGNADARAHSLGGFKATEFEEIKGLAEIALHIAKESQMHVEFCKSFAVGYDDLQSAKESPHTSAYARYILDIGMQGDLTELLVAVASCLIGYGEVGLWLLRHSQAGWDGIHLEGNAYRRWIEDYSGREFQDAVHRGIGGSN
jgi:hydroxymethylpyrimidine/phosphomethylpyrimidine kinase / thiaminase